MKNNRKPTSKKRSSKSIQPQTGTVSAGRRRISKNQDAHDENYRLLIEQMSDGVFIADHDGYYIDVNPAGCRLLGYTREELLGKHLRDVTKFPSDQPLRLEEVRAGKTILVEREMIRKDGTGVPVEISAKQMPGGRLQGIVRDITARKQSEKQVLQLTRLYATLSQVNQAIVRVQDRPTLFQTICEIATQVGKFRLAWVGLVDHATGNVTPVAHAGEVVTQNVKADDVEEYLRTLNINLNDPLTGYGLTGSATRTGQIYASDDIQSDTRMKPWRTTELRLGFCSSVAIPFRLKDQVIGTLNLYSTEQGFFSIPDERSLLEEIGLDISYALDAIETETDRRRAEEATLARTRELDILLAASRGLAETLKLETILQIIVEKSTDILGLETGAIYLLEQDQLNLGATIPPLLPESAAKFNIAALSDHPHIQQAIATGAPVILPDTATITLTVAERAVVEARQLRSLLYIPLTVEQNVVGVLILGTMRAQRVFSPSDIDLVLGFGRQAALAITNAKLYNNSKQYAEKLEEHLRERQHAEQALRESEERYRSLFHNNHAVMLVIDPQTGAIQDANPAAARFYGWSIEELRRKNVSEINTLTPEQIRREMARARAAERNHFIFQHRRADGTVRDVEVYSGLIKLQAHEYLYSIVHDITEQKRAAQSLRLSEEKFAKAFRASPDIIILTSLTDGRIIEVNDSLTHLTGYTHGEIIGKTTVELQFWANPSDRERYTTTLQREGRVRDLEVDFRIKSGEIRRALLSGEVIELQDDKYILGVIRDITERKLAEEALRESEARYRLISENTADVIWVLDPIEGKFTYVSPSVEKLRGYTPAEVMAQPVSESLTPESFKAVSDLLAVNLPVFLAKGIEAESHTNEVDQPCKDGSIVHTEVTTTFVFNERGQVEIIGVSRDVTERKRAEGERRRLFEIVERSRNEIYVFDAQTLKFKHVNHGALENLGYTLDAMKSMTAVDIKPAFTEESFRSMIQPLLKRERERLVFETAHRRADGSLYPVEVHLQLVDDGNELVFLAIINDITERKRADEALRLQSKIAANLSEGISLVRVTDNVIVYTNSKFEQMFGYAAGELIGKPVAVLNAPDHSSPIVTAEAIREKTRDDRWTGEIYNIRKDGTRFWSYASISQFDHAEYGAVQVTVQQDITERKQVEEALRESEWRNRLVTEMTTDYIFIVDVDSTGMLKLRWASDSMVRLTGRTIAEVTTPDAWNTIIHPADAPAFWDFIKQVVSSGNPGELECRTFTKAGAERWIQITVQPSRDASGKTATIIGAIKDVNERRRAEEALRNSEAQYRLLFENNPNPMWAYDPETYAFLAVNDAAVRQYGYSRDEFLAMTIKDIRPAEDIPALEREVSQLPLGLNQTKIWRHRKKDGTIFNVEITSHWSQFAGKSVRIVLANDVTERERAVTALRESEERYRLLAEAAHDNIFVIDQNGCIEYINQFAASQFDRQPAELIGTRMESLFPSGVGRRQTDSLQRVFRTRESQYAEAKSIFPQREIWLGTWLSPLFDERGQVRAVLGISRDITTRKRAEETAARQLAELEAVNRVSTALRVAQTQEEILPLLLDQTLAVLNTDSGIVWLAEHHPHPSVTRGWFTRIVNPPMQSGAGIAGQVFSTGKTWAAREFASDPQMRTSMVEPMPAGWGGVCMPIHTTEGIIGVIMVSVQLPRELNTDEVNLLATLAEIAGNAIHRMRLHRQTVRQLERLAALHMIDSTISNSLDLRRTLAILLEQTTIQLRVDAAAVLLLNPHLNTLEFSEGVGFRGAGARRLSLPLGEDYAGRAALDRRMINIPNLKEAKQPFTKAHLTAGEDFIAYYVVPLIAKGQVKGVLEIFHRALLSPDQEWLAFLETLAGQAAMAIDNTQLFDDLKRSNFELGLAYDATIEGWSRALDLRDKETEDHTKRVVARTLKLARAMGMSDLDLVHVRRGALLHDIGKMGVPDSILLKPDTLTPDEWEIMRRHPAYARDMLYPITYLRAAIDIPFCHHEKWDGSGYPQRLKGDQIPLAARIFAVIDVWDALSSNRPYRPAWQKERVIEYIRSESGKHFDPQVADTFLKLISAEEADEL